ncbi:MAG: TetR/AcrR family transcriptional regulator [Nonomuraea sp.]|nr:TetR/AcrR family transcriptional regulator [Nonomuraea sp.]NUP63081.1 TetR/AcrR family transcriptional regulator [Nonomuraea sp.]NUS05930.1 TetR/AcrR family transcriptional regulator [Nonomuraea sp.]
MMRRTQVERSDETTARLVTAARRLFGENGFAETSIDAVAAAAGVTKGAAYHHFTGKAALFRAAFTRELEEVAAALERAGAREGDPLAALRRGCRTFLEHCLAPGFRQIVLLDAPSVLGWGDGPRDRVRPPAPRPARRHAQGGRGRADRRRQRARPRAARLRRRLRGRHAAGPLGGSGGRPAADRRRGGRASGGAQAVSARLRGSGWRTGRSWA